MRPWCVSPKNGGRRRIRASVDLSRIDDTAPPGREKTQAAAIRHYAGAAKYGAAKVMVKLSSQSQEGRLLALQQCAEAT